MNIQKNKGISLLEILLVLGIIVLLVLVIVPNLSKFHKQQVLKNTTEDVISLINEARNNTISSLNSSNYGIRFYENKVEMFAGITYISPIKEIQFDNVVLIPNDGINLSGGGDDIMFERITGNTNQYGTILIQLESDSERQNTITVNKLGIVSTN